MNYLQTGINMKNLLIIGTGICLCLLQYCDRYDQVRRTYRIENNTPHRIRMEFYASRDVHSCSPIEIIEAGI